MKQKYADCHHIAPAAPVYVYSYTWTKIIKKPQIEQMTLSGIGTALLFASGKVLFGLGPSDDLLLLAQNNPIIKQVQSDDARD